MQDPSDEEEKNPFDGAYELELLYVLNDRLTDINCERMERVVKRAYPEFAGIRRQYSIDDYRFSFRKGWLERLHPEAREDLDNFEYDEAEFEATLPQIKRVLRARDLLEFLRSRAHQDNSVHGVFDRLERSDNASDPVCSTTPGAGLLVFRHVKERFYALDDIEDSGVQFSLVFRFCVVASMRSNTLPLVADRLGLLGLPVQGRCVLRIVSFEPDAERSP